MNSQGYRHQKQQQDLERGILYGLACEWEHALVILSESCRKAMRLPLFSLQDWQRKWGAWTGHKREIALSRHLVFNHSWEAVREVLLHEMAHQLADEVLGGDHETAHGPKFRKACFLLRANPKASGQYQPLDERISSALPGSEDKVYDRVKKLMALAESSNRHEAELAMARAHELITKHHIDSLACEEERDFTTLFVGRPALRHFREEYELANLLQDFYFVQGIWVPAFVLSKGKMGRVLEISGTVQNIRLAAYVYDFVHHFIDGQWTLYNQHKGLNRFRKTDFAVGIIQGFRSKLTAQGEEKRRSCASFALIKTEDPMLDKYLSYRYPHTVSIKRYISSQDEGVLTDGKAVGKQLVIHKGINEKANSRILPLLSK